MSWADRISMLVAAGAIVATLGVGTCSTNARFEDVNRRIDDVNRRIDALQADIRELRSLVIDAIKRGEPAD
jgi:outer membrane murein-binding lipoprotein Lpp